MKPSDEWVSVAIILILVAGLFLMVKQRESFRAEAIKRGAAEWVVNPLNGETTFKWKELKP